MKTSYARGWSFLLSGMTVLSACGDDSGGETPREDASTTLDARIPDGGSTQLDGSYLADAMPMGTWDTDAAPGTPPKAGFTLSDTQGSLTLWVKATSSAVGGAAPIVETEYDFGDGFTAQATHRFSTPGTFTVQQRVRDNTGLTAMSSATVKLDAFKPVKFSTTDHGPTMHVSPDGAMIEERLGRGLGRTDGSIAPGSGVFYFEGTLLADLRVGGLGVTTAAAAVEGYAAGDDAQSVSFNAQGSPYGKGSTCIDSSTFMEQDVTGFVIDYRGTSPTVYAIQRADNMPPVVKGSCAMTVTAPVFAGYWSDRNKVGYEARINTGWDTVNNPFQLGTDAVKTALTAAGHADVATALVAGFGSTRAPRVDQPPVVTVPATMTVAVGTPVTITGSAIDAEDGDLSAQLTWLDTTSQWNLPVGGTGASFTFTPKTIGKHPVTVTSVDGDFIATTKTVMVTVTGTLLQPGPVKLTADATSGPNIKLSADGLSATFLVDDEKMGVKANQGLYGDFWYFEVHRLNPIRNMGIGLMVGDGTANPYDYENPAWAISLNVYGGFWRELIPYNTDLPDATYMGQESTDKYYGFAVDYRGDHPTVYAIVRGVVLAHITMDEVWTEFHPLLYGNVNEDPSVVLGAIDMTANFGTAPFQFDAKKILSDANHDITGMKLGWGVHAK